MWRQDSPWVWQRGGRGQGAAWSCQLGFAHPELLLPPLPCSPPPSCTSWGMGGDGPGPQGQGFPFQSLPSQLRLSKAQLAALCCSFLPLSQSWEQGGRGGEKDGSAASSETAGAPCLLARAGAGRLHFLLPYNSQMPVNCRGGGGEGALTHGTLCKAGS